jgi:hypothetical protein
MPRKSLQERRSQLEARLQQLRAKERAAVRADQTRALIVLGGALLAEIRSRSDSASLAQSKLLPFTHRLIETHVVRDADKGVKERLLQLLLDIESEVKEKSSAAISSTQTKA